jgi:hypothetical protein
MEPTMMPTMATLTTAVGMLLAVAWSDEQKLSAINGHE